MALACNHTYSTRVKTYGREGQLAVMYSVSDSGWMEASNFLQWFEKMFLPSVRHLTSTAPVILFLMVITPT